MNKYGALQVWKSRNHGIHLKILVFEIMKSWCYCTILEQINSRKLLNLLFNHIPPINDPTMAIPIPIFVPMIFPKCSYDFPIEPPRRQTQFFQAKLTHKCLNLGRCRQAFAWLWLGSHKITHRWIARPICGVRGPEDVSAFFNLGMIINMILAWIG